ncbi:hypothetical protein WR25_05695 [Diploscapter pachys]|uniref:Uncharacterized protein n=1 Tax=Diploscapter pachys TaxID=2018661 RepID=A0A2A2K2A0_9BILA|nr:hypothetical protein WR25_05695 [Diploscapter pachys]
MELRPAMARARACRGDAQGHPRIGGAQPRVAGDPHHVAIDGGKINGFAKALADPGRDAVRIDAPHMQVDVGEAAGHPEQHPVDVTQHGRRIAEQAGLGHQHFGIDAPPFAEAGGIAEPQRRGRRRMSLRSTTYRPCTPGAGRMR